jgi:hypothetical protein
LPRPVQRQHTQKQRITDLGNALWDIASFAIIARDIFLEMAKGFNKDKE